MTIPFNKPFLAGKELYYIADSVMSGKIAGDGKYGRQCQEILGGLLGADSNVLLTTSCTSALEIAAMLLNIGEGDEVILPSYTFVSTANAFCIRGAKPVFVDLDPKTLNLDVEKVAEAITENTKAIIPVHYAGFSCDMDRLMAIANAHSIPVVEDAAQAICSTYKGKPLGSFGALSTFSFHETKNINCGEGGALVVNDPSYFERAEILREKGTNRANFFRGNVDKYTWVDTGSSYVLSDVLAAYLAAQLENIEQIQFQRQRIFRLYSERLASLAGAGHFNLPFMPSYNNGNAHMFYLLMQSKQVRDELILHLAEEGIHSVFHYVPLHSSPVGRQYGYQIDDLPITGDVADRLIRLPLYVALSDDEVIQVTNKIRDFFA